MEERVEVRAGSGNMTISESTQIKNKLNEIYKSCR